MKEIYISLNRENALNDLFDIENDEHTGDHSRELHLFPAQILGWDKGTESNPWPAKIQYVQSGNSYGPSFNYKAVSIFDIRDLFNQKEIGEQAPNLGHYSDVRSEAIEDWENNHPGVDRDDHIEAVEKQVSEWIQNAVQYDRDAASSAMLDEIVDEEKEIMYKIIWMEE
jgi:hypothetical protein